MRRDETVYLQHIKEIFDSRFQHWQITLPVEGLRSGGRGSIHQGGWTINYRCDEQDGRVFLEYFASHRMTNDTLNRIYEDGTSELVGYCQEFFVVGDEQAEQAYYEHNRKFYDEVKARGLG